MSQQSPLVVGPGSTRRTSNLTHVSRAIAASRPREWPRRTKTRAATATRHSPTPRTYIWRGVWPIIVEHNVASRRIRRHWRVARSRRDVRTEAKTLGDGFRCQHLQLGLTENLRPPSENDFTDATRMPITSRFDRLGIRTRIRTHLRVRTYVLVLV